MKLPIRQILCVLLSVLLLVQTAGAALYPGSQLSDTEQMSQQMSSEQNTESHDCCDEAVKACCSCDLGCDCSVVPAFLSKVISAPESETLFSSLLTSYYPAYISQALKQPDRPPRD